MELKSIICIFVLAVALSCAMSARLLDELDPVSPATTLPSGQIPVATPASPVLNDEADPPLPDPVAPVADVPAPVVNVAPPAADLAPSVADLAPPAADVAPVTPPVTVGAPTLPVPTTSLPTGVGPVGATVASQVAASGNPTMSFFMHDILGGTHPSARVVTGVIARTDINGIPFSQPNNNIFPLQGGIPLTNLNNINNIINPSTVPFITGLNGAQQQQLQQQQVITNTGNNNNIINGNNQPFVTAGQLPAASILQKLMFGTVTVVDDQLTEGHELGSSVIGKAQGFYLASSLDGTSHTLAMTFLLHDHGNGGGNADVIDDTISIFGVHRAASDVSHVAIIGGTGKYENAKGYVTVETMVHLEDQHTTDGVDTISHFNVYLSE